MMWSAFNAIGHTPISQGEVVLSLIQLHCRSIKANRRRESSWGNLISDRKDAPFLHNAMWGTLCPFWSGAVRDEVPPHQPVSRGYRQHRTRPIAPAVSLAGIRAPADCTALPLR